MSFETLNSYQRYFSPVIPRTPTNRFVSIILLRETKSYAIFTTETGEQQDVEQVAAGLKDTGLITRLVMFKRKQIAPERRTGKALLRQYGIFPFAIRHSSSRTEVVYDAEELARIRGQNGVTPVEDCYLVEGLCTHCPDCVIYGYAAIEGEGARRSRLMTDTCFSIRPYELIQKRVLFNVIDEVTHTSGTITPFDYTIPGVFLPSIETGIDLTMNEFVYVLGNILRTTRYGKEGSRQGFMRNHILAIAFSDVELFSNLEFTQAIYDSLTENRKDLSEAALTLQELQEHARSAVSLLTQTLPGRLTLVEGEELERIMTEVRNLYQDEERIAQFLRELNTQSALFTTT